MTQSASDFMAQALYHPERGYYRRPVGPWGFEGKDYYTALDLGPLLGETLALRLEKAWERLGRPGVFTVLEPGAGRGWLGRDLLSAAKGDFAEALLYLHRDDNPAARCLAEQALEPWAAMGKAQFRSEAEALPPLVGAILSNELFDALPAQPWRWTGEAWEREVLTEDGPGWEAADPGEAGQWFAAQAEDGLQPGDGSVWCEGLPKLVKDLCGSLQAGLFLAIDYGESASRLLSKGADLRRYKGHAVDGRWWEEPGEADLTADVDFTRLESLVRGSGLTSTGHISLSRWIREHAPLAAWEEAWLSLDSVARIKRMENLLQLTLPTMMGERFRVLEAWREP
ncbi:MAG: hypothetical protein H6Q00_1168 [Holophagaceae bacterium]|nr:hypothetical protein [Holophagaceae bacterium]